MGGGGGGVLLGMPGPWADDNREPSDFYTSKIGGLPDWPFPVENLAPNLLICGTCGSKLCLVSQVYAPISSGTSNIEDRTILVFGCIIPNCGNTPLSWRALRVQKVDSERESSVSAEEEVPSTPPVPVSKANWLDDDSDEDIDLEALSKALSEAGTMASHSKKKDGNQRSESAVKNSTLVARTGVDMEMPGKSLIHSNQVVPCFYMYTQEPSSKDIVSSVCSNYSELFIKEKQNCDYNDDEMGDAGEQEVYEYDKALSADRTYLKFKKQLDAYPDQCFRHLYGGKPLLATAELGDPGNCKLCGGFRHFEMQLMPQLISFLLEGADDCQKIVLENWNWMTLVVYTCPKSCSNKLDRGKSTNSGWIVAEEAVLVQFEKTLQESIHTGYFS
ncbi:hypothetical protein SADUNF_Sadunf07G0072900 [Salix dunnii]|uniref:Programmed cell death protein 2 C-terminal domain-containing protein n=1 Tax=Salix dunnii TaxID=1413687 RepID=A0A835K0S7_9ROSI|nr:hypothetical protein SADUNF_Sadunf07G0072900 [Salix dunnii]